MRRSSRRRSTIAGWPGRTTDARGELLRAAAVGAVAAGLGLWLVIVVRQIADGGFYSDDWVLQWEWHTYGFSQAVHRQFDFLGSKPLLAFLLIGSYEVLGTNPAVHHLVAAVLTLGCAVGFYFVLRGLRLPPRDAIPIALLALLFPWATSVRLWPTAALNNVAVLLLFAGFLIALRGLRVEGSRGLLIHLAATACYVASILNELRDVSVASRINKPIGDKMIMNAAFLISRNQESAFDRKIKAIASRLDPLTFKYTGPWPPYNFVNIRLKLEPA